MSESNELIEKKRRLANMLKEAAALATECGIDGAGWQTKPVPESIAADEARVRESIAFDERAALPIAIGGTVQIYDRNTETRDADGKRQRGGFANIRINKVGRALVHTNAGVFQLSNGQPNDGYNNRWIVDADMIRIRRDLVKPVKGGGK